MGIDGQDRNRRRSTVSVLAALLLAATGTGTGWYLASTPGASQADAPAPTVSALGDGEHQYRPIVPNPSDQWQAGAVKAWSTTVGPDAEVVASADHVYTIDSRVNLTAYKISENNNTPTQAWASTLNWNDQTPAPNSTPTVQQWGDRWLIHGATLYDLATGAATPAPWGSGRSASVADDVALSCDASGQCSAWSTDLEELWSTTVPGAGTDSRGYSATREPRSVVIHEEHRYISLGTGVVDIDSGALTRLALPDGGTASGYTRPAVDGWVIAYSTPGAGGERYASFDLSGAYLESYERGTRPSDPSFSIYPPRRLPTLAQAKQEMTDPADPAALGRATAANHCLSEVAMTGRPAFAPPAIDGATNSVTSCLSDAHSSASGAIVLLADADVANAGADAFRTMVDADTGERIALEGSADTAALTLTSATTLVSWDSSTGALIGYRAAR